MNHLKFRKISIKTLPGGSYFCQVAAIFARWQLFLPADNSIKKNIIKGIKVASKNGDFYKEFYIYEPIFPIINIFLERKVFLCEKLDTYFKDCIQIKISW